MDSKGLTQKGFMGSPQVQNGFMNPDRFTGSPPIYRGEPLNPEPLKGMGKLTVVCDNREQTPLIFTRLPSIRGTLQSGDYSAVGLETELAIERKSLDDLAGSVTSDRERFERELHRLRGFRFKRLLIVGSREDIEQHNYRSKALPKAILNTLSAFECRYDLPIVYTPTAEAAAMLVESWVYWNAREALKRVEALTKGIV